MHIKQLCLSLLLVPFMTMPCDSPRRTRKQPNTMRTERQNHKVARQAAVSQELVFAYPGGPVVSCDQEEKYVKSLRASDEMDYVPFPSER